MKEDNYFKLLDRPFMYTLKKKIDVYNGSITMEFDRKRTEFNTFDHKKNDVENQSKNLCFNKINSTRPW